ncbi:Uncharacterized protein family (UPF0227) [Rivularia sp. PCC 7116]|uniref:YqiA/YcfP family alpha/beta fold hydrolase n=1 Tax=Rivularia sp. PCC 7116 TaxID=373994 RepID=UPI00029EF8BA|nr:YqiA/YcfP family alpha/beta fold hydrolase [Rivularia sp. PCC 7116]AFY53166.1 Uncharacterized protein family (UPF0227) [Rivularia sp. PCC 7116]
MHYIYLHGFASSPNSNKARYIAERFAKNQIKLEIPDLNCKDFYHLTITRQLKQVAASLEKQVEVTIIGSSLGGLTAAYIGEKFPQVKRLVLLAPAFEFLSHWLLTFAPEVIQRWQQEKYLMVYHYGQKQELPLSYDFVLDANQYHQIFLKRPIPTLILHGKYDEVIPIQASRDYAQQRYWADLIELNSDHILGNAISDIWQAVEDFCQLSKV